MKEWLTNQQQKVVIDGKCSSSQSVLSGAPQSTVLGMFFIFINDITAGTTFHIRFLLELAKETE